MAATALDPIVRVCLETATGKFYSLPWDPSAGLHIIFGDGVGLAAHNGTLYLLTAADQTGMTPPAPASADAAYNPDSP